MQNTFTHILSTDSNNNPEVRSLDPNRRAHRVGSVFIRASALLSLGKKSAGPGGSAHETCLQLFLQQVLESQNPELSAQIPCVHPTGYVRASHPSLSF